MAKKDETEEKPEPIGDTKPSPAETKPAGSARTPLLKNRWFLIGLGLVLLLVAGFAYSKLSREESSSQSEELSYAEELETHSFAEGIDQTTINSVTLNKAWAHFNEGNYGVALERLGEIKDPDPDIKIAVDDLYGEIYRAQGQADKAKEYSQSVLDQQEETLLENVDDAPNLHFSLARLYENAGDTTKAKEHYQAFIDEFGESEDGLDDSLVEPLRIAKEKASSL